MAERVRRACLVREWGYKSDQTGAGCLTRLAYRLWFGRGGWASPQPRPFCSGSLCPGTNASACRG
jgi:hypothetical protein